MAPIQAALSRRNLLLAIGAPVVALAGESDVLLEPTLLQSVGGGIEGDEVLQVWECQFRLPQYGEREHLSMKMGRTVLGSPMHSRATALIVTSAKRVRGVYLHPEHHEWQNAWACDLLWEPESKRWIFGFLSYWRSRLAIEIFDVTDLRSDMAYPLRLKPTYKVRWPKLPAPIGTAQKELPSAAGDIQRLALGTAQGTRMAAVFHRAAGVVIVPL